MENKNLIRVLGQIGMTPKEAEEEIRKTGVKEPYISNYQDKESRKVYDILCPLYLR